MDIDSLQRSPDMVHSAMKEVGDTLIALKQVRIYIPEHYVGSYLAYIDDEVRIIGIHGIVVDGKYLASSRCCAMMSIDPSTTNIVSIKGENFYEFTFEAGETIIKNLNLVQVGTLLFRIFDEFNSKGNIPWYLSEEDVCLLFDTAEEHAGASLGVNSAIMEMVGGSMARSGLDKSIFYRHVLKSMADKEKVKPFYIPLKSVAYGATNTTAKISGAYFEEGMTSALITPSERNETIEELLRK